MIQSKPDLRWLQRFQNFSKALIQLEEAASLHEQRPLSNIEKQGFVKAFEFTHELAWNVMKDYFTYQGNTQIMDSRDATREAFQKGMIMDGKGWMEMIKSRNKAVHTYDEGTVNSVIDSIVTTYPPLFLTFSEKCKG